MTSQFGFPFDETTDIGRRTIFQTFLRNQNQLQQQQFQVPDFSDFGRGGQRRTQGGQSAGTGGQFGQQGGFSNNQQGFLSGLFQPAFNQFLGTIGGQLQQQNEGGQDGISSFGDFLNNDFNPQKRLARATQRQQGINTGNLIGGRSRFLTF